jgi:hypothetical protein
MKRITKNTLIALVSILVGVQLIPVDRSNPAVDLDLDAPIEVKAILKRSCYDCHSNEVDWPWYSYVAPISWLISHDVKEGREELNFSEWNKHSSDTEMKEEIIEEIEEGEMPLPIYLITHSDAAITEQELVTLKKWAGYPSLSHADDHDDKD